MSGAGPLPFLEYCGVEVANAARTVEYLRGGLANSGQGRWELGAGDLCGVLYRLSGGTCAAPATFVTPATDPAPWYDPTEAGSISFLGLIMLRITGYDSQVVRTVSPKVQGLGGGTITRPRRTPRVWTFRAAMISADDTGAEYGLRWLNRVLQAGAPPASSGAGGGGAAFGEPYFSETYFAGGALEGGSGETIPCVDCDGCWLRVRLACPPADCSNDEIGEWTSYDVVMTSGPKEVEPRAPGSPEDAMIGCRDVVIVEWEMTAANPFLYKRSNEGSDPVVIGEVVECEDIEEYLFGDPGDPVCIPVAAPSRGTVGAIFTFESVSGMGAVLMEAHEGDCPPVGEGAPVLQMGLSGIPAGTTVVVDCARRTVTVTDADGDTYDGRYLLTLPATRGLEWIEARDCDPEITCFCARTGSPCSQGADTTVSIATQRREG